jgi:tRNA A-37 threonylcarbamoyl transferase component Bud32
LRIVRSIEDFCQHSCGANSEQPEVHQLLEAILKNIVFPCLRESHISSSYSSNFELPMDSDDPSSKDCRRLPDFSIRLASIYDNDNPTYVSAVVQIECKEYGNVTDAVNQAAGYAMERLKCLVELYRDLDRDYECYSFGTDGDVMIVVRVALKNGKLTYASNKGRSDQSFLWPTNAADIANVSLHELGGMVALLSLLTYPQALKQNYPFPIICHKQKKYEIMNVLGMGGFGTVLQARNTDTYTDQIAVKVPIYWDSTEKGLTEQFDRLLKEADILASLSSIHDPNVARNIPRIFGLYYYSLFCIVTPEVGISLQNYIAAQKRTIELRREFCRSLESILIDLISKIHQETGITHRDIRPQNIMMLKYNDNNHYQPLLIDWGLAGRESDLYHINHNIDFLHDDLIQKEFDCQLPVLYKLEHDLASVEYTSTAIIYALPNLQAPWSLKFPVTLEKRQYFTQRRFTQKVDDLEYR